MAQKTVKKASPKKKHTSVKWLSFFKSAAFLAVMFSLCVFLFLHRETINTAINGIASVVKEKIAADKAIKKPLQAGYKQEDRKKLEQLVNEEAKHD